ncbi:hypothetical protein ACSBR2_029262 [Camellia fascicularis]
MARGGLKGPVDDVSVLKYPGHQHPAEWYLFADLNWPDRIDFTVNPIQAANVAGDGLGYVDEEMQEGLIEWLEEQGYWKRNNGRDHVIICQDPNALYKVVDRVENGVLLVSDFGQLGHDQGSLVKDVILPYSHRIKTFDGDVGVESRKSLLFFMGNRYRKEINFYAFGCVKYAWFYYKIVKLSLLIDTQIYVYVVYVYRQRKKKPFWGELAYPVPVDCSFTFIFLALQLTHLLIVELGSREHPHSTDKWPLGFRLSHQIACRLFDAIVSLYVPVIVSDYIELPFEDVIDYRKIAIFVNANSAVKPGYLVKWLRRVSTERILQFQQELKKLKQYFEYEDVNGTVKEIWRQVSLKVPLIKLMINRDKCLVKRDLPEPDCSCICSNQPGIHITL